MKKDETVQNIEDKKEEKTEKQEIEKLKEKIDECEAKYKRALADYQNLEKRTREERGEWIKSANRDLLLRVLPVLDTLMAGSQYDDNQAIKVTLQQFLDILKAEGVVRIETIGKKFDPHIMECVEKIGEGDEVIAEVRAGYMLYDKLLRAAQVKVGKK
jgi:molecular chaperone GrpE